MADRDKYVERYEQAKRETAEVEARGVLTHTAAALARQIRWNPDRLAEFTYPLGMEMGTTCCLHVMMDDPNYENDTAAFCLEWAEKSEHPDCIKLARMLVSASVTQRKKISRLSWSAERARKDSGQ